MNAEKFKWRVLIFFALGALTAFSCGDDPQSPQTTGKVLLAEVAGDSVSTNFGSSTKSQNVSTGRLDFTDRDSAEISFTYAGNSNNSAVPLTISFTSTVSDSTIYSSTGLILNSAEHSITVTLPSPKVKEYFFYTIKVVSGAGYGFFRFRDMKIYKK